MSALSKDPWEATAAGCKVLYKRGMLMPLERDSRQQIGSNRDASSASAPRKCHVGLAQEAGALSIRSNGGRPYGMALVAKQDQIGAAAHAEFL